MAGIGRDQTSQGATFEKLLRIRAVSPDFCVDLRESEREMNLHPRQILTGVRRRSGIKRPTLGHLKTVQILNGFSSGDFQRRHLGGFEAPAPRKRDFSAGSRL